MHMTNKGNRNSNNHSQNSNSGATKFGSKPNPDDRSDNVEQIQKNINHTIQNIELAEEMIAETDDDKVRRDLTQKNKRRQDALEGFRKEIKDEAAARDNDYRE